MERNLASNPGCMSCGESREDGLHAIRDFRALMEIWMSLVAVNDRSEFFSLEFKRVSGLELEGEEAVRA